MTLLDIGGLICGYKGARALHGVDLHVGRNEIVGVIGPNGAGKTTLLRAVSGAIVPEAGSLMFEGNDIGGLPVEARVGLGICHCPEGRHLFSELSVMRNLQLGAYLSGWGAMQEERLVFVHELFPVLKQRSGQLAGTLSGGEQQMVAIGRALMGNPRLLLLDEPSVGIAHRLKQQIFGAVRRIRDHGTTILIVEQDASIMLEIADRAYLMEGGKASLIDTSGDTDIMKAYMGV